MTKRSRMVVEAQVQHADAQRRITVNGKEAETLVALVRQKPGVSGWDFPGGPPYRLGAYVHDLRHKFGLSIRTDNEPHAGGWHARYVLLSDVEIIAIRTLGQTGL
jgi:hypothetical protein